MSMSLRVPLLRRAFVGAAVAWTFALPLASLAASEPHPSSAIYLFSFFVYLTGSLLCHQLPERSFHLWGRQMPVCARCTGIYAGAAIAALVSVGARLLPQTRGRSPREVPLSSDSEGRERQRGATKRVRRDFVSLGGVRLVLLLAAVPAATTIAYEWTTGQTPANWIRAMSGVPLGAVAAWIVLAFIQSLSRDEVN